MTWRLSMAGRSHARCASVIWLLQKSLLCPCPCRAAGSSAQGHRIVFVARHEHADAPYAVALLRARRKWPRSYREASARELTWRVSLNRRPLSPWISSRLRPTPSRLARSKGGRARGHRKGRDRVQGAGDEADHGTAAVSCRKSATTLWESR